jgi:putative aldouronate transport system permease protein
MKNYLRRLTPNDAIFYFFNSFIMIFVAAVMFYPFYYMLMLSFSSGDTFAKVLLMPHKPSTLAYELMIYKIRFLDGLKISISRSLLGPVLTLTVTYFGAFALSHKDLLFRKFFARYIVFAMYFSAGMLPGYINMVSLHLTGTFLVYIIPGLVDVFGLILIRTYIEDIPKSLEESAAIDGANDFQIAIKIVFPMCLPVIAALALFSFIGHWNAYIDTLIYNTTKPNLFTLQYILFNYINQVLNFSATDFANQAAMVKYNMQSLKMAMTVVVCVPIFIVYPFLQKYFIKGIMIGSIKG